MVSWQITTAPQKCPPPPLPATVKLRDGKTITDMDLGLFERLALKEVLKKIQGTDIDKLLKEYHVI